MSHSWGDNVFRAFMRWAAASDPEWVERHVAAYINVAGPVLGVPKAITALLSGATSAARITGAMRVRAGTVMGCMRCQESITVAPCRPGCPSAGHCCSHELMETLFCST